MSRPLRAVVALVVLGWASVWLTTTPVATPSRTVRLESAAPVPADVLTSAAPFHLSDADRASIRNESIDAARANKVERPSRSLVRPRPTPPVVTDGDGSCGSWGYKSRARSDECWRPYVARWSDWDTERMLRILYCESKGNPFVVNESGHAGLLQIAGGTAGDGPANIELGHSIWLRGGYGRWTCR